MSDRSLPRLAFLGLGVMGFPMVERLRDRGFGLVAWNRSTSKANGLAGVDLALTPAEAASRCDFVCLCLTDADAVRTVLFDTDGASRTLKTGAVIIDFSTIGPQPTRALAGEASALGLSWLDAPVSGGPLAARKGELTIFCGGTEQAFNAAASVLSSLGRNVSNLGATGSGQAMKLCNQLIVSANLVAVAEAVALARALGIDATLLPSALLDGFADSLPLQLFAPKMAARQYMPFHGAIATMLKDVDVVRQAALDAGADLPILERVREVYVRAQLAGLAEQDLSAVQQLYT